MRLVILGGSGSGKSTQAQQLCDRFEVPLVSTGDILREAVVSNSELGKFAQPFVERGELVPDELMIEFVKCYFSSSPFGGASLKKSDSDVDMLYSSGEANYAERALGDRVLNLRNFTEGCIPSKISQLITVGFWKVIHVLHFKLRNWIFLL
ncbi:MAG: nucleoside monophosphate kinase, partial [Methylacidiphilales bacterium]|nr:nucleoside monophosphate kinase [Candidatus Methylacidiphilales bacterium]